MDSIECMVIGAGVVGLAIARALASAGKETIVVDAHAAPGSETSSRNSEVIHAGIYYPKNSLKAILCVRGRHLLYEYCRQRNVEHLRCGKLIVATSEKHREVLEQITQAAIMNGVNDLRLLEAREATTLEPQLECVSALLSPSTGIIDSHGYMLTLQQDAEQAGATVALRTAIEKGRLRSDGVELYLEETTLPTLKARWLINCAGLHAPSFASRIEGFPVQHVPRGYYAKGCYFALRGRAPFSHLIYPVPEPGGLGTHLTLDLAGQARFGPDVEWIDELDYTVDPERSHQFYDSIRRYWPALRDDQLIPGYAGIRPKISDKNQSAADFRIDGPATHGVAGIVNLFGIESPGLTASLAIGEHVANIITAPDRHQLRIPPDVGP